MNLTGKKLFLFLIFISLNDSIAVPSVRLYNAAKKDVMMPINGLGTGVYDGGPNIDARARAASKLFMSLGGRRIDGAVDYPGQKGTGEGIIDSGVPRNEVFITSKVGVGYPMGYQESLDEFVNITQTLGTDYIDLLLIHWPGQAGHSWPCYQGRNNFSYCRTQSWKALETLYRQNKVRAIGVSNFETNHIQEIIDMGGEIPAVNQCEFNLYWNEPELVRWGQARNITFNSYSPLGAPDAMKGKWDPLILDNPVLLEVKKKYPNKSAAQITLRWALQQGIVVNPRSFTEAYMKENLDIFDFEVTSDDMWTLSSIRAPSPPQPPKVCPDPHNIP